MIGKKKLVACLIGAILIAAWATAGHAATITWTSTQPEGNWSNRFNWTPNQVPTSADDVIHDGSGAGIILVDIPNAACRNFTATAGGSPLRRLRVKQNMRFTLNGIFEVVGQTDEVRYLVELKELATLWVNGGTRGGDFTLGPHSQLIHDGSQCLHFRNGVWRLQGGRFFSREQEFCLGIPGESGKVIVEKGGHWIGVWNHMYVDEIEVHPQGSFWGSYLHPEVRVTNNGGAVWTAALSKLLLVNPDPARTAPPPLPYAIPDSPQSPLEEQAAFILANFGRDQINLWISVLGDRAGRAATPEQRAELEEMAGLLANGAAP